jgi:deoxyadenosine/deoxycytidine kinase
MASENPPLRQIAGPAEAPGNGCNHIVVAGTIATGKTTLTEALASTLGLAAMVERPKANPFLERFYADQPRWALASQLWFATDSARQHRKIQRSGGAVQDHSVYENVHVFGAALADAGVLTENEWQLLLDATGPTIDSLPSPSIVLLVEAPVEDLMTRIRTRGRPYEAGLDSEYLTRLSHRRREYFEGWERSPVVLVDSGSIDLRLQPNVVKIADRMFEYLPSLSAA